MKLLPEQYLLIAGIIFGLFILFWLWRRVSRQGVEDFSKFRYKFIAPSKDDLAEDQSVSSKKLSHIARNYANSGIDHIILIHGTFVGDDPLLLNRAMERKGPQFLRPFNNFYRKTSKKIVDYVGRDLGNFTEDHKNLMEKYFKQRISIFNWSGSNNHYGRLAGAVDLIDFMDKQNDKNYLLIAHSHGGQILALMTQLYWDEATRAKLLKEDLINHKNLAQIKNVRQARHLFVTMGTPVRYKWKPNSNSGILHFINHRGQLPKGGNPFSALWNNTGDYIQQFGGAGSDYFPIVDIHYKANSKLERILEEETQSFMTVPLRRQRLHHEGLNLLVDYQDVSVLPNFHKTIFGHAVYTRYHLLAFHLELVLKYC